VLWTLALVGFIIFVITDFAALVAAPAFVVPGIQAIRSGQTVNSGLDFDTGNWTFNQWGSSSAATYRGAGGNPGGFLEMSLPSSGAQGYWWQAFNVEGSVPFTGAVHLDIEIAGGLTSGRLVVAVDSSNSVPDPNFAIGIVQYSGPTASWTAAPRFLADARLADPGVYYLKVAFIADSATSPVTVGFDNMRLGWTTDAAVGRPQRGQKFPRKRVPQRGHGQPIEAAGTAIAGAPHRGQKRPSKMAPQRAHCIRAHTRTPRYLTVRCKSGADSIRIAVGREDSCRPDRCAALRPSRQGRRTQSR